MKMENTKMTRSCATRVLSAYLLSHSKKSISQCYQPSVCATAVWSWHTRPDLAPVPLSIFRSNSKFDENSKHSSVKYTLPITTIFCTRHDSVTVVTCAKYRCDRSRIFETRAFGLIPILSYFHWMICSYNAQVILTTYAGNESPSCLHSCHL